MEKASQNTRHFSWLLRERGDNQHWWIPGGGTPRNVPNHDHSLNWKKTPFAHQIKTVADPYHIQSILPHNPFCTDKISKPYYFHTAPLLHILILSFLISLLECCLNSNNQWKDPNTLLHNSSLPWKLVSYRSCIVFPYQMWRQLPYGKVSQFKE